MAKVRVEYNPADVRDWMASNPEVKGLIMGVANDVMSAAQASASDAEGGPGGRISGYADAGFSVKWTTSGRPQARVVSNADPKTFLAAHFHSLKKNGVAHLRAALYSVTHRG